jgi:hypothetical protein
LRRFDLLRASFLLLAAVVLVELLATMAALGGCFWLIVVVRVEQIGACRDIGAQIREVWAEMLAAILALLLAGRPPAPPPGGQDGPTDGKGGTAA